MFYTAEYQVKLDARKCFTDSLPFSNSNRMWRTSSSSQFCIANLARSVVRYHKNDHKNWSDEGPRRGCIKARVAFRPAKSYSIIGSSPLQLNLICDYWFNNCKNGQPFRTTCLEWTCIYRGNDWEMPNAQLRNRLRTRIRLVSYRNYWTSIKTSYHIVCIS